ncbi:MAG TPA: hypothetical protein DCZ93_01170 [Elusimicrobia bacterium]|nr:hypothetical protein [Elusimicrobiota bacterium]
MRDWTAVFRRFFCFYSDLLLLYDVNFDIFTGFGNMSLPVRRYTNNTRVSTRPMLGYLRQVLFSSLLAAVITSFPGLVLGVDCPPYEPSYYCLETKVTVGSGGQYPRYIQKSPGSVSGHTEGAGFGCVTGGVGVCGWSGHDWSCSITAGGLASGAVTYTANLQSETCEYPRTATSPTFSILVDAGNPQATISFPDSGGIVKIEDNIRGEATDDYQLGAIYGGAQHYSFLGTRTGHDDGGTIYFNDDSLRSASWELPVSAVTTCKGILQGATFYLSDAVGNTTEVNHSMYVDCVAPVISINEPAGDGWTDPLKPVIRGNASDDIALDKIWLTIKDETADRYWDGSDWVAGGALIAVAGGAGEITTEWEYSGLTKDNLRSGVYTIRAYARDKVGRIGSTMGGSAYKKRYYLGSKKFTAFDVNVKTVTNERRTTAQDSFTTLSSENSIFILAEILPARVAPELNGNVRWTVAGMNTQSGRPSEPVGGNPSRFRVSVPPIPAWPSGRPGPLGYRVFARVEQDGGAIGSTGKSILQDELDQCRQEYVDMNKLTKPGRADFTNAATYVNPGDFPFANSTSKINYGQYHWAVFSIGQILQDIRNEYGGVMLTSSGYRNPRFNASLPKSDRNSPHIYGEAADIDVDTDDEWLELCDIAVAHGACVEPHSISSGWVHMGWPILAPACRSTWPHGAVPCELD